MPTPQVAAEIAVFRMNAFFGLLVTDPTTGIDAAVVGTLVAELSAAQMGAIRDRKNSQKSHSLHLFLLNKRSMNGWPEV